MSDEEKPPNRCPQCRSLNVDGAPEEYLECRTCGNVWVLEPEPDGPWRTGKKVGRTIYYRDELVGLVDKPELADMLVIAANVAFATLSDERVAELREVAKSAKVLLEHGPRGSHVVAQFVLDHLKRVEEIIGGEEDGDGTA